jgi:hypothetical protein
LLLKIISSTFVANYSQWDELSTIYESGSYLVFL